jgi:outer membrane protein assembly factor BamA
MTQRTSRFALVALLLLVPVAALAQEDQAQANVNSRYRVASVSIVGVPEAKVSQALRDDMQKLVGNNYDPAAADALAHRLRKELHGYTVAVKVRRGEQNDSVKVVFEAERGHERSFDIKLAPKVSLMSRIGRNETDGANTSRVSYVPGTEGASASAASVSGWKSGQK